MISICFSISRMLNGPTVLLKNSTTSLCNPVINNLSSRSSSSLTSTNNNNNTNHNHNDNDQIKPDLSQSSSCLSTTLFTNYSMHPIHNHSIYTTNLSSSINYDNTTTTTLNHHNQAYQLSDSLKRTHFNCPNDTLFINQIIKDNIKSSEQLTSTIMIKNDDIIQIRRRLPPLGKSDSSETGLQINNNNNNETNSSIVTTATKIVIEPDPNEKNSNNNDNIGQHKTIEEGDISNEEITSGKMLLSQSDSVNIEHK